MPERQDRRLGRDRRRDEDRRDRADERPDDRDDLGERRDQREQERAPAGPMQAVGDARRDADRGHQDELAADPQAEPRLDLVPGIADARRAAASGRKASA